MEVNHYQRNLGHENLYLVKGRTNYQFHETPNTVSILTIRCLSVRRFSKLMSETGKTSRHRIHSCRWFSQQSLSTTWPSYRPMFYELCKYTLWVPVKILWGMNHKNRDRIPDKGPAILASNHVSFSDHFFLPGVVKRRITFVAKAEYFEKPFSRFFFSNWGQIPIKRGKGDTGALAAAQEVLEQGDLFGIYPEGTRSVDGSIHKGKTGVARLALMTGAPIIPVGMLGTFEAQPKYQKIPKPYPILIKFGKPLDYSIYKGQHENRELTRAITDQIMLEIEAVTRPRHLLDPEYRKDLDKHGIKRYNRKRKGEIPGFPPKKRKKK